MENEEFQNLVMKEFERIRLQFSYHDGFASGIEKRCAKIEHINKEFLSTYKQSEQFQNEKFFKINARLEEIQRLMNRPYSFAPKKTLASKIFKLFTGKQ